MPSQILLAAESSAQMQFMLTQIVWEQTDTSKGRNEEHNRT